MAADGFLHPWMLGYLFDSGSLGWVEGDHPFEEVSERIGEIVSGALAIVCFPEDVKSFLFDKFVVGIVGGSFFEGWIACVHDEQDHP